MTKSELARSVWAVSGRCGTMQVIGAHNLPHVVQGQSGENVQTTVSFRGFV